MKALDEIDIMALEVLYKIKMKAIRVFLILYHRIKKTLGLVIREPLGVP